MQYLVSLYFDEKTDKKFRGYMKEVADYSGSTYMVDHGVPPHITIASFVTDKEEEAIESLEKKISFIRRGNLQWVSVGALPSGVLYIAPVLNEYLHGISKEINAAVKEIEGVKISKFYQPFQWLPHATIGKRMNDGELAEGFACLQSVFTRYEGCVVRIGLATKNPYREIFHWELRV